MTVLLFSYFEAACTSRGYTHNTKIESFFSVFPSQGYQKQAAFSRNDAETNLDLGEACYDTIERCNTTIALFDQVISY